MKKTICLLLATFLLCAFPPSIAKANILEFFFPSLKNTRPDPSKTLEAPFANKTEIENSTSKNENADNAIPLDLPHRSPKQMTDWALQHVADHLTFISSKDFQSDKDALKPFFTSHAWTQYESFLESANINAIMTDGRYSIRAVIDKPPEVINKGAADGAYRWFQKASLMVTYLETGQGYEPGSKDPVSQHIALKIQLGRYNNTGNDYGVLIDHWNATVVPTKRQN